LSENNKLIKKVVTGDLWLSLIEINQDLIPGSGREFFVLYSIHSDGIWDPHRMEVAGFG